MGPPALPSDPELRERAAEILARGEYQQYRNDERAWIDFYGQLYDWYSAVWDRLQALQSESPLLYWTILAGLFGLAVLLLVHVVWTVRIALRAGAPESDPVDTPRERDLRGEAERLAAAGHFLEAARRYQLACLELLIARGDLELRRSDPNSTLRQRLTASALPASMHPEFRACLDSLEAHWFRDREDDPELYRSWRSLHGALQDQFG